MTNDDSGSPPDAPPSSQGNLTQLLVALQKSFSRVSNETAEVSEDGTRSMILGDVKFRIETRVDLQGDALSVAREGGTSIGLEGTIYHDVREEAESDAPEPGPVTEEER